MSPIIAGWFAREFFPRPGGTTFGLSPPQPEMITGGPCAAVAVCLRTLNSTYARATMVVYRPMYELREGKITQDQSPRRDRWRSRTRPVSIGKDDLCGLVRGIVDASPGRGEGGYVKPSPGEASGFAALADAMNAGDLLGARGLAAALGYALDFCDDVVSGRQLLVARDASEPGRAWGAILVDPEGNDVLVEVAHPGSDLRTPEVGVAVFRETRARALLVAGANRIRLEGRPLRRCPRLRHALRSGAPRPAPGALCAPTARLPSRRWRLPRHSPLRRSVAPATRPRRRPHRPRSGGVRGRLVGRQRPIPKPRRHEEPPGGLRPEGRGPVCSPRDLPKAQGKRGRAATVGGGAGAGDSGKIASQASVASPEGDATMGTKTIPRR